MAKKSARQLAAANARAAKAARIANENVSPFVSDEVATPVTPKKRLSKAATAALSTLVLDRSPVIDGYESEPEIGRRTPRRSSRVPVPTVRIGEATNLATGSPQTPRPAPVPPPSAHLKSSVPPPSDVQSQLDELRALFLDAIASKTSRGSSRVTSRAASPGLSHYSVGGNGDRHGSGSSQGEGLFLPGAVSPAVAAAAAAASPRVVDPSAGGPAAFMYSGLRLPSAPPALHPLLNNVPGPNPLYASHFVPAPESVPIAPSNLVTLRQFARGVSDTLLIAILNDKFDPDDLYKLEPRLSGKKEEEKKEILNGDNFKLWFSSEKGSSKKGSTLSKDAFTASFAVYAEVKNSAIPGSYLHYSRFMQTLLAYEKTFGWPAVWEYFKAVFEARQCMGSAFDFRRWEELDQHHYYATLVRCSFGNLSHTNKPSSNSGVNQSSSSSKPLSSRKEKSPKGSSEKLTDEEKAKLPCFGWNRDTGCSIKDCKFRHVCQNCSAADHKKAACPAPPKEESK